MDTTDSRDTDRGSEIHRRFDEVFIAPVQCLTTLVVAKHLICTNVLTLISMVLLLVLYGAERYCTTHGHPVPVYLLTLLNYVAPILEYVLAGSVIHSIFGSSYFVICMFLFAMMVADPRHQHVLRRIKMMMEAVAKAVSSKLASSSDRIGPLQINLRDRSVSAPIESSTDGEPADHKGFEITDSNIVVPAVPSP